MINPYNAVLGYDGHDWPRYLDEHCLIDIFQDLLKEYPDRAVLSGVIKYIVWAYSAQSDKVIIGMEWQSNKQRIFEQTGLPFDMWQEVGLLKSESVLKTINRWLQFQDNDVFVQWCVLKDLKVEMQLSAVSPLRRGEEIDYDQKFKNANYALELRKKITDLQDEFIQNDAKLKDGAKEVRVSKRSATTGVEHFVK